MKNNSLKFAICHQMPERSFKYKGKQFPLCARCTGIFIGYFTFPLFQLQIIEPSLSLVIILSIPMFGDSITQSMNYRESNNILRVITGFLFGAAQVAFIVLIGTILLNNI
jgi:uncharacterized membrane protein